jgi:hypothetical protein
LARSFRIAGSQLLQSLLEPGRIELMDGEDSHTALGASRLAHQPLSATAAAVGERSVNNLYQLKIASREHGPNSYVYPIMNGRWQKR